MTTSRIPGRECPSCGIFLSAATSAAADNAQHTPERGDLTICACGVLLHFGEGLILDVVSHDAEVQLPEEVRAGITQARRSWRLAPPGMPGEVVGAVTRAGLSPHAVLVTLRKARGTEARARKDSVERVAPDQRHRVQPLHTDHYWVFYQTPTTVD